MKRVNEILLIFYLPHFMLNNAVKPSAFCMLLSNLVVFDKTKTIPCKTVARRFRMIVYSFRGTIEPFM